MLKDSHIHPQTPMNLIAQDEGQKEAGEIQLWTAVLFVLQDSHVHPQTPMNLIAQEEGEKEAGEINKYVFKIVTQDWEILAVLGYIGYNAFLVD